MRVDRILPVISTLVCALLAPSPGHADDPPAGMSFERLAAIRSVSGARMAPDGRSIAYRLVLPRRPGVDDDGPAWIELHLVSTDGGPSRPMVHGEVSISRVRFTSDGRRLTYLAKRGEDEHAGLWAIPVTGGESFRILEFETEVEDYRVSPDGTRVAFLAKEDRNKRQKKEREKGYKQEIFEEDWRPRKVWIADIEAWPPVATDPAAEDPKDEENPKDEEDDGPQALEIDGSVFGLEWSPDGTRLALSVAPRPLIDDRYMMQRIHVVDATTGEVHARIDNPGKLGPFAFSPDGRHVALISAAEWNDPKEGRLMLVPVAGGELRDLIPDFEGHVSDLAWQDERTVLYLADVGAETELGEVDIESRRRKAHARSGDGEPGPVLTDLTLSADGTRAALVGERPGHPREVFTMGQGDPEPRRLTDSNPWLGNVALAPQEVVRHTAADGLELEGILIRPLDPKQRERAPLLLIVHGGPEGHVRNGWNTSYSRPGQLAAARGYAVFYPNYRGSTGRGVAFSRLGQGDAAGKEFDDLIDAVDHLAAEKIIDADRVGITGGSYGGYATAWCSTRFTERFRAGMMSVGITNKISKALTTEIPQEDKAAHTLFDPWTKWQFSLERSPLYHAEKSRTALLIAHGTKDTRVHPSQSLQLYRALKLIGETPVRYVRYPGEGHGNRRAAARDDYTRRLMRWMDHFVVEGNSELPPWELDHGLDEEEDEEEDEE